MNTSTTIESVNNIINIIKQKKIAHLYTGPNKIENNVISIDNQKVVNFGSCSYLGLEFENRVTDGAKNALDNYGSQFSCSRAYLSVNLYEKLEELLSNLFRHPVVVTPTTTLGHIAAIPILVDKKDAVILDHQVHSSVQTAVKLIKSEGTHVEMLRHNNMEKLETRIIELSEKHQHIWYMADGIYSMFGDFAPLDEIHALLEKYPKFHLYIDDAHGMSCFGERGQGYVLSQIHHHDRMVVATSFAKAFATGGGALIFPNQEMADRVRNCGGPMITSGPLQPANLGAAIEVAKIHLSEDILTYQKELKEKIKFTNQLLKEQNLPNLSNESTPVFFIGVGIPKLAYDLVQKMKDSGHFLNVGIFPAVPIKNSGVRFTITRLHSKAQIKRMVEDLAFHFYQSLIENNYDLESIYKDFRIKRKNVKNTVLKLNTEKFQVNVFKSIIEIDKDIWNSTLGTRGMLDWGNLSLLEKSFANNKLKEENWDFNYVIISDTKGKVILSSFYTTGIYKDDMLASLEISEELEKIRLLDPYYGTSKFLCVGSLITEGDHIYLNKQHDLWKVALKQFINHINQLKSEMELETLIIRDLPANDSQMDDIMLDNGYFKINMPLSYKLDLSNWQDGEFLEILSKRSKKHFKQNVRRFMKFYKIDIPENLEESELFHLYQLYSNVHAKGLEINTYKLPFSLFKNMANHDEWDIIRLKVDVNKGIGIPNYITAGVVFAYKGKSDYVGGLVGIDYDLNIEFGVYRQAIYQFILRANELNYDHLDFGFCAGVEKKKFGAKSHLVCAYVQQNDNYKMESLAFNTAYQKLEERA
ncbi:aminotransferase class I/II-fold pyridoxal phosphate-dependent enzyme [Paracrocinitomix mangrovi]|uniref:aminotransferase class I/II-fold pyridoxal phosphate-dependent enzyme n=1 Tax=Paracrocinitomix mangrovi TaxID=2862509 RepID=UPI001C8CFFA3|nr:aminotransferase class I/II-fold pyridoxal phosphate-dependent enzyme [Paracrocinitomix mangrovi]UKN01154.1 aminotransferase class I/II-fold pyridoxal phosphate-dependent enzyme [Paracrocinitomix mangrovi]